MQFFSRVSGSRAKMPRARRRRAAIGVEPLEGRKLLSADIPGVSLQSGALSIAATMADHNTARVAIDPANGMVEVTLNGRSVEYDRGAIWSTGYTGGQGGWDTFVNDTDLTATVTMYGGNNTGLGGSTWNTVKLWGDNNSYDARGGASYVFAYNGPNDRIAPYGDVTVFAST
jgi:hypothetical protein